MNEGKICVSVCAKTTEEMISNIRRAEPFADIIEVRFDCLSPPDVLRTVESLPKISPTYLFTFRPKDEGGTRDLTIEEKLNFWEHILHAREDGYLIDLEFDPALLPAVNPLKNKRIVSMHNFDKTPADLDTKWEMMSTVSDSIVKMAVRARDITDAIRLWKLLDLAKSNNRQIIAIAMGDAGKWTRILGLAHGAFLTYASVKAGCETAPGQLTAKDLINIYRVKELSKKTKVYGVIGNPVSQSLSTYMHNPAFVSQGIDAVFIPFLVKDIKEFMRRMVRPETREVELNFGGFAVTMPHKQSIMKHLDAIDPTAEKIGAVNTVKIDGGTLTGYNTDAHGFITPLKKKFGDLRGSDVAVFGGGGAARACVHALKQEGANVSVIVRDAAKALPFTKDFGVSGSSISNFKSKISVAEPNNQQSEIALSKFQIIVDATPLGMSGANENESLFTADELAGVKLVYDLVTKADDTPIIREAKKAGVATIGGLEMLVAQGAMQHEIWTGKPAPLSELGKFVRARIREMQK